MSASFSSSIAPVAQVAQVAQVASWLWSRRACVAGGVTALATANYLRKHASATHSHQQQHPVATTAGDADASSVQRVCPPAVVSVDKSLFPSLIASPSVPGVTLFTRCWRVSGTPRALVFLLHGYGEHSGRYESLAACLNSLGVSVYALDHVGHGQSGGDRAYVERLHHYVHDALTFIEGVQKSEEFAKNQPPAFLFGPYTSLLPTQFSWANTCCSLSQLLRLRVVFTHRFLLSIVPPSLCLCPFECRS
jgi:hypothetical protein